VGYKVVARTGYEGSDARSRERIMASLSGPNPADYSLLSNSTTPARRIDRDRDQCSTKVETQAQCRSEHCRTRTRMVRSKSRE
jgi:hypothetical protein